MTESARAQVLATEEARRGVVLSLVSGVANGYVQLRALDEQLAIALRKRETYAESVRLFELQFKHGVQSQMTVEQARTQYETAAAAIPQLEAQIAQTENGLSILLGRNPGPIARGKALGALGLPEAPAGIPSQVLERRPDIRQAEQVLVSANAQIGAAKALYFPSISLTGALGIASLDLGKLFSGPSGTWSYQGSIAGPIFTAGRSRGRCARRRRRARRRNSPTGRRSRARLPTWRTRSSPARNWSSSWPRNGASSRRPGNTRASRGLQFDGGVAPYFTVIQAEQQLFPAELTEVQLRASLITATVNLYKSMGGGWVLEAEKRTR